MLWWREIKETKINIHVVILFDEVWKLLLAKINVCRVYLRRYEGRFKYYTGLWISYTDTWLFPSVVNMYQPWHYVMCMWWYPDVSVNRITMEESKPSVQCAQHFKLTVGTIVSYFLHLLVVGVLMYGGLYIAALSRSVEHLQQDNRALQTKIQALEKVKWSVYKMYDNYHVSISTRNKRSIMVGLKRTREHFLLQKDFE